MRRRGKYVQANVGSAAPLGPGFAGTRGVARTEPGKSPPKTGWHPASRRYQQQAVAPIRAIVSAGTGMFVSHAAHVKGWRSRSPAGTCRLYFLSRATKSTKKCPSCDLCRANGGRGRLKSRGAPAVESIHSQRPVPGASISLREDDAGPCGLRRCEAIKVCCPGTQRSWDGGRCRRPSRAIHLPERV